MSALAIPSSYAKQATLFPKLWKSFGICDQKKQNRFTIQKTVQVVEPCLCAMKERLCIDVQTKNVRQYVKKCLNTLFRDTHFISKVLEKRQSMRCWMQDLLQILRISSHSHMKI